MRPLLLAVAFALCAAPALANTYYRDSDKDGYGNPAVSVTANFPPYGYVSDHGDCNDNNPAIHPGANEICDGVDQNCNGAADDGVSPIPAYRDYDGDGYGQIGRASCRETEDVTADLR